MQKFLLPLLFLIGLANQAGAQYAPQAGVAGSTAIPVNSPQIMGWATGCTITRGLVDIAQPGLGWVTSGDSSLALGPADNFVVSLGDSGMAVLRFSQPVYNGPGPDFAVFENGFANPDNPEQAFLELAFVEVSSDGNNFFRFPSAAATQVDSQIAGAGDYMDARKLNNLAGKYIGGYGTPFDLEELIDIPGLDLNHITHIRLVDVIGSIDIHPSSVDDSGRKINDPYPTAFPTGGFDLDAVAALHQFVNSVSATHSGNPGIVLYPNPAEERVIILGTSGLKMQGVLYDPSGKLLCRFDWENRFELPLGGYQQGIYYLSCSDNQGDKWVQRLTKR